MAIPEEETPRAPAGLLEAALSVLVRMLTPSNATASRSVAIASQDRGTSARFSSGIALGAVRKFNLRAFHDFVWKNGNVPISLQRWEYLGVADRLPK